MKIRYILLLLFIITGCSTSPNIGKSELNLDSDQWEPVNKNKIRGL